MIDNVNHPKHYETGKIECIEAMIETQGVAEVQSFCVCNAFKYLWRHKRKNQLEDVKKAIWYLNKFVELEAVQNDEKQTECRNRLHHAHFDTDYCKMSGKSCENPNNCSYKENE